MHSYDLSLKKRFEKRIIIQLLRNLQKTLTSYHEVLEAKILFQKQSPISASKKSAPKTVRRKKKKIRGGGQNMKDHWLLARPFVK